MNQLRNEVIDELAMALKADLPDQCQGCLRARLTAQSVAEHAVDLGLHLEPEEVEAIKTGFASLIAPCEGTTQSGDFCSTIKTVCQHPAEESGKLGRFAIQELFESGDSGTIPPAAIQNFDKLQEFRLGEAASSA